MQSKAVLAQARGAFPRQTNHRPTRAHSLCGIRCGACNQRNMPTDGSCRASVHAFGITAVAWRGAEWSVSVGKRTAVRTSSLTARRKVIERVLSLAHADSQPRLPHAQHSTSDKAEAQRLDQSRASAPSHWSRNDTGTRGLRGDVVRGLNFTLARVVVAHHKHHRALGEHVSHLLFGPFDGVRYLCKGKPLSRCGTVVRAIHAARAGQCKRVHGECDEGEPGTQFRAPRQRGTFGIVRVGGWHGAVTR